MSDDEISVVQEKIKDNPFVKLQQNFSSYYKIHKETANSSENIAPVQLHLPRYVFGKECPFRYVSVVNTVAAIVSEIIRICLEIHVLMASCVTSRTDLHGRIISISRTIPMHWPASSIQIAWNSIIPLETAREFTKPSTFIFLLWIFQSLCGPKQIISFWF
jgi:hypothetical protein